MTEPLLTPNPPRSDSTGLEAQMDAQTDIQTDIQTEALAVNSSPAPASEPSYLPGSGLEALGERIAVLSAQIQAATYHLLVMIREFDERHGWNCGVSDYAFRSCAHWLNWRTGLEMGAAREKVRVARALARIIHESWFRG